MKRFVVGVFLILMCILLALWSPWLYWKFDLASLFGIKKPDLISGLQVFSLSGEVEVFLDNTSQGKVKVETSPFILDKVTVGEHLVTLKRVSSVANAYWNFSKLVTFEASTNVVISYNLGPQQEFSEGQVIYATKKIDLSKQNQLNLSTNTSVPYVQVDNANAVQIIGTTYSQAITLDTQHKVKISKSGFESLEFTVLPESQEDRNKLKDYDINVETQLMYRPIDVN